MVSKSINCLASPSHAVLIDGFGKDVVAPFGTASQWLLHQDHTQVAPCLLHAPGLVSPAVTVLGPAGVFGPRSSSRYHVVAWLGTAAEYAQTYTCCPCDSDSQRSRIDKPSEASCLYRCCQGLLLLLVAVVLAQAGDEVPVITQSYSGAVASSVAAAAVRRRSPEPIPASPAFSPLVSSFQVRE